MVLLLQCLGGGFNNISSKKCVNSTDVQYIQTLTCKTCIISKDKVYFTFILLKVIFDSQFIVEMSSRVYMCVLYFSRVVFVNQKRLKERQPFQLAFVMFYGHHV